MQPVSQSCMLVVRALEAATGLRRALAPEGCLGLSQAAEGNLGAVCTGQQLRNVQ